ncbi:type VI secretion system Vgr family protein [Kalamiella sp. sgz302252]|uniref:type VI secretion system Vgr family protein n=1 Tax=Pantoea sp. sgz302252 TaxID=3341827 RepID=UPI0036D42EB2
MKNNNLQTMISALSMNRYLLAITGCDAVLDVENFTGSEGLSRLYRYQICFTSPDSDIPMTQVLRQNATLTLRALPQTVPGMPLPETLRIVHGVVTGFQRLSGSADQTRYEIILEPFLALLSRQIRSHRFFVGRTVPEVVEQILTEHGLKGWEYDFHLKESYPVRGQINQYHESDLAFIERLLAEVGIHYFFTLHPETHTEVVHFSDRQGAWEYGKTLPLNSPSGTNDNGVESVWGLTVSHGVAASTVTTGDYNHRAAHLRMESAAADVSQGADGAVTYGDVWLYGPGHNEPGDAYTPETETGNFYARLAHERQLCRRTLVKGESSDATLGPGQVITVTAGALSDGLPVALSGPLAVMSATLSASRETALRVAFDAVPNTETRVWRPELKPRPVVSGTLTARVTSARSNDQYAWQDAAGLYRVKFDADRDERTAGQESMPVRLAKPYGGDLYGFHFPLIQGTEVAIAFHNGDPDRPYIAHALHDSRHPDHVTEKNDTRNVIRTPANNKLRMEDKRGEEHIKLATEYGGKTQLNLGHNVNAERQRRGEGAELRTDAHVAIRGGKGVLISAQPQPQAGGEMLAMAEAVAQLEQAQGLAESLNAAAKAARAELADIATQQALLEESLKELKQAALLLTAPAGIAQVTPKSVQLSAGENVTVTSGKNANFSILKKVTMAAGERISLYAQKAGIKLFAGKGKVEIEAQSDEMGLAALKDIRISSSEGKIVISAKKEILLTSGGGYIRIADGTVECAAPDKIIERGAVWQKFGGRSISEAAQSWESADFAITPQVFCRETGKPAAQQKVRVTFADGSIKEMITDDRGHLPVQKSMTVDMLEIISAQHSED